MLVRYRHSDKHFDFLTSVAQTGFLQGLLCNRDFPIAYFPRACSAGYKGLYVTAISRALVAPVGALCNRDFPIAYEGPGAL